MTPHHYPRIPPDEAAERALIEMSRIQREALALRKIEEKDNA